MIWQGRKQRGVGAIQYGDGGLQGLPNFTDYLTISEAILAGVIPELISLVPGLLLWWSETSTKTQERIQDFSGYGPKRK